jgi:hypothetical protein
MGEANNPGAWRRKLRQEHEAERRKWAVENVKVCQRCNVRPLIDAHEWGLKWVCAQCWSELQVPPRKPRPRPFQPLTRLQRLTRADRDEPRRCDWCGECPPTRKNEYERARTAYLCASCDHKAKNTTRWKLLTTQPYTPARPQERSAPGRED